MARQDTKPAGHALQSDPYSPGNRICEQSQQACLEVAIHFHVQRLSGVHWTHPAQTPTRKKDACYDSKVAFLTTESHVIPLLQRAENGRHWLAETHSHVILLSSFSPFSSLSDACVSSAVSLNSSSQQQILSEFFFCLLLSFAYLMRQKPMIWLSAGTVFYSVLTLFIPSWPQSSWKRHTECHQQQGRKSHIIRIYLKATFKTPSGQRWYRERRKCTWDTSTAAQVWQHTADVEYFVGFRLP